METPEPKKTTLKASLLASSKSIVDEFNISASIVDQLKIKCVGPTFNHSIIKISQETQLFDEKAHSIVGLKLPTELDVHVVSTSLGKHINCLSIWHT